MIELEVVFHPFEPGIAGGGVWDVDVSFAGYVLGVGCASYC